MTNKQILAFIDLGYATVSMREDGIAHTNIFMKDSLTVDHAKELLEAFIKVSKGGFVPHLFTPEKFVLPENEVLDFIKNEGNKYAKADAFVITSLPQKIIGNFFLKFHKPEVPTKLFVEEEKAIKWLYQFVSS